MHGCSQVKGLIQQQCRYLKQISVLDDYSCGSAYIKHGKLVFKSGIMDKSASAYGYYNDTLMTTGWGVLEIRSGYGPLTKDNDIMYAAGYMEGMLTAK